MSSYSRPQKHRSLSPVPSCVSMKSDRSRKEPITFSSDTPQSSTVRSQKHTCRSLSPVPSCVSMKSDRSIKEPITFSSHRPQSSPTHQPDLAHKEMQQIYKSHLQKTFQCLIEGSTEQGNPTPLSKIYTDLYITVREIDEHEVKQIERASWQEGAPGRPVKCSDVFKTSSSRTVLTKGVAGVGKTVSVQKFILDWAEEKVNLDVHFIFPLPFRELNLMKEKKLSLVGLIQHFFSEIETQGIFTASENRVMFIFDGLDECRLSLGFGSNPRCSDVTEPASVDVLLTNLIEGNLLPAALLWITTRPAAANQIPPKLSYCKLTEQSCFYLASALTVYSSSLRLLDLSDNKLLDSGVELLCSGLQHQNCKLEELQLINCNLTEKSCFYLASVLSLQPSTLRQLDMSDNELLDSGVELLCSGLHHKNCQLEELQLSNCNLTDKSCFYLASALTVYSSSLKLLDLSDNKLLDSGVELLCSGLCNPNCKLKHLWLTKCALTEKSCSYLASALSSHSSSLGKLNLSENKLLDSGVELLCHGLCHDNCRLEDLLLSWCKLTEKSCSYLASALTPQSSSLKQLDLRFNNFQKSDAHQLSTLVNDPNCKLETIELL